MASSRIRSSAKPASMPAWLLVCFLAALGSGDALAGSATSLDCEAPCLAYSLTSELQYQFVLDGPLSGGLNELSPTTDIDLLFAPTSHLGFVASLTYESVRELSAGQSPGFADLGLYAVELYAAVDLAPWRFRLGKIDPVFGLATAELGGLHATDLAGNYDLEQRLGGEASYLFEAAGLSQAVTASVFTTDRTFLSDSVFANRLFYGRRDARPVLHRLFRRCAQRSRRADFLARRRRHRCHQC